MATVTREAARSHPPTVAGLKALRRAFTLSVVPPSFRELHDLRISVDLSQADAGAAIGVTASHLSRVESGKRRLRLRQVLLLQSVLLNYQKPTAAQPREER